MSPPPGRADTVVLLAFVVTGIASVLLGPLIPELRAACGVTTAEAGQLFVAQFTASSIGAVLASFRLRFGLVAGYGSIALGLALLALGGWPLAGAAMALTGLGLGLAIVASNLWTAHRDPRRRAARLATLNLAWGAGAVASPLLFVAVLGRLPVAVVLGSLAAIAGASCLLLWMALPADATAASGTGHPRLRSKVGFLVLMAAMFFVYVGVENAVGGWLVSLADALVGERSIASLVIGSGFWSAILAGRAATPWILRHASERTLYLAGLATAAGGTLLLVLSPSRGALAAGALAAGLGMAPLFPLTVSILAAATAATGSRETGWVLALGGLGGAALPWVAAQTSAVSGALRDAFLVPLAGLVLLGALYHAQQALEAR